MLSKSYLVSIQICGMSSTPTVSILMPVRNAGLYLEECLDSMITQSYTDWELIAIDDHSDDNSAQILTDYAHRDKRIHTYPNDGRGIIHALRLAYSHSRGQLITRMDADDIMTPDKIEQLSSDLLQQGSGQVAIGGVEYFSETELGDGYVRYAQWLNELTAAGTNYQDIYRECVIPSPCWMLHREDLDVIGAFNPDVYPEDYDLVFRMYQAGIEVIPSTAILHRWRDHGERSSRNDPNYLDNRFLSLKCHYFQQIDYDSERPLIVWGAGKKGKAIVKQLSECISDIIWITDNPKKLGKDIYDIRLQPSSILDQISAAQLIIAVANPTEQQEIIHLLEQRSGLSYYRFC